MENLSSFIASVILIPNKARFPAGASAERAPVSAFIPKTKIKNEGGQGCISLDTP